MPHNPDHVTSRRRDMIAVARAHYLQNKSKLEIADELGISRFVVARLLKEARETGLVTITINTGGVLPELSARVCEHLGLSRAQVIEAYGTVADVRAAVGHATGAYLSETLRADEVLGIGWGRTVTTMIEDLEHLPPVDIVQLTGSIGSDAQHSAMELARRAALLSGRTPRVMFAPFYVPDAHAADVLRRQPEAADVIRAYDHLTTAVVAVGSLRPRITQTLDHIPSETMKSLLAAGAQAEICGIPFGRDGAVVDMRFARHCLSVSVEQLRRTPRVIAVVSDARKAEAVMAISHARIVNEIVVDVGLAQSILALPSVKRASAE